MVGSMYGLLFDMNVVGFEVNFLGEDIFWFIVEKVELD